jgi:hypothetical protein
MTEDFHVDMSGRIYKKKTIGIACVGTNSGKHNGCALRGNLIKFIQEKLCIGTIMEEHAKLYAICIYYLIKNKLNEIETLIICNDEEFNYVRGYLTILLGQDSSKIKIISIFDLRKQLGRNINSLADNFATSYRKRALKPYKWNIGKQLDVVNITYEIIQQEWIKLEKV